ncbi:hypothetical protein Clacol_003179 [Clathrus columnatus]|uniref:HMG box domain-containing protein n=1 Tax=Clathrus columnatus TaxID=1419009 RepID=A0AAV5A6T6_9AGAM|nr:hypothetical protein Clacol_003179 [Clathrus columnatus]
MSSSFSQQRSSRQDEQDMQSYSPYSNPESPDDPEDENVQLRSQALNADGTPKRPMNAFMIFARRRRPQVSSANQMMRTGEISKILSKEWNTMPMSDKQFYLDQAKKLKENFNSKYPDYVYRRRPNNSRKKRRSDSAPYDHGGGLGHDYPDDYDSVSAVDPNSYRLSYAFPGNGVGPTTSSAADAAYYSSSRSHHDTLSLSGPGTGGGGGGSGGGGPHGPGGASLYNPQPNYATESDDHFPPLGLWPPHHNQQQHHQHHHQQHHQQQQQHHHHHPHHQQHNPFPPPPPQHPTKLEFPSPKDIRLDHPSHHHPSQHNFSNKLGPAFTKPDPWSTGDFLRLSSRRGLHPLPLLPTPLSNGLGGGGGAGGVGGSLGHGQNHPSHHVRNWSDSTASSSVSPPSSAGSASFPPGFGGSTNGGTGTTSSSGGNTTGGTVTGTTTTGSTTASTGSAINGNPSNHGFQTLTAPFFPGGSSTTSIDNTTNSTDSPSISSISTTTTSTGGGTTPSLSSTYYSNTRGESYDSHPGSRSTSSSHQRYPTLALSPASVAQSQNGTLWSSMRTKAD